MKFTMTIDSENEAVVDNPTVEVLRALRKVRGKLADGISGIDGGKFLDVNGNSIGEWSVEP
jgi:hypothetical protein